MASDMFLKIKGIEGESTDDKHKGEIEILSYSHSVSQPTSAVASSSGGGTTGRCAHADFTIMKSLDKASPVLSQKCCTGEHIDEITLTINRASGDKGGLKVPYMVYKLTNAVISNVGVSGSQGGGEPTENVSFNYGKIEWEYTKQDRKGGAGGGKTTGSWNLEKNKP